MMKIHRGTGCCVLSACLGAVDGTVKILAGNVGALPSSSGA